MRNACGVRVLAVKPDISLEECLCEMRYRVAIYESCL